MASERAGIVSARVSGDDVFAVMELRGRTVFVRASVEWTEDAACRRVRYARVRDQQPLFDLTSVERDDVERALFDEWAGHHEAMAGLIDDRI